MPKKNKKIGQSEKVYLFYCYYCTSKTSYSR